MDILLLNGGGLDTLAAAMKLQAEGNTVHSLHVICDMPAAAKIQAAAAAIAAEYCASHKEVTLSGLAPWGIREKNPFTTRFFSIPQAQIVFSCIAASHALKEGITAIANGVKDREPYGALFEPAITELHGMNRNGFGTPVTFQRPLDGLQMADVLEIIKDSPILHQTVSCLQDPPCGTCGKCKIRASQNI